MTELLPCPFCGGEAKPYDYWAKYIIECDDCTEYGHGAYVVARTEAEAIAAWNTRAERTCRNLDKHHNIMFKCSECGHWECQDFDGEKILPQTWNYCPNCGCKVVDA